MCSMESLGGGWPAPKPPSARMNIKKNESRKIERKLANELIKNHIPFEFRKKINNLEVDFLVNGNLVVELDGVHHLLKRKLKKDAEKNATLLVAGYSLYRISTKEFRRDVNKIINRIKNA